MRWEIRTGNRRETGKANKGSGLMGVRKGQSRSFDEGSVENPVREASCKSQQADLLRQKPASLFTLLAWS
jgi:hypothetical protein